MPHPVYTEDEDSQAYSGWTISALEGAANRDFRNRLQGRFESVSSVRQQFDQADIDRLRRGTREQIQEYAKEFNPQLKSEILSWSDTVSAGTQLTTRQYVHLKQALGLDPLDWTKSSRAPKEEVIDLSNAPIIFGGLRGSELFQDSTSLRGTETFQGSLKGEEMFDGSLRGEALFAQLEAQKEEADPYPVMPKRRATIVDSMSMISLLDQPRPFTVEQVDELFLRVGKKDPFAAAAFGTSASGTIFPKWMISEATAKEAKRIINEELGVDLTYQGQDFAMPADWMHRDGPTVKLDPSKQRLVDGLLGWAVANAEANKLSSAFSVDPGGAFGVTWTDRRYRADQGAVAHAVGVAQGAVGRELTPYMLDVKDPILSMLFPDGRLNPFESHPVQEYMREAGDFLLSWLLPGTNVRDIKGRHWVPKDVRSTVYSTINNLRAEFGAPQMGTILDDDARIMPVSFLKNVSPENYTRGWFGFNPGGKDILDWQKIRNAKESMEIMDPALSATSTLSKFSFVGGRLMDAYSGKELNIEDAYRLRSMEWNEKKGGWDLAAPRVSPYQLDHMLPLAYLWEHGYSQIADKIRHEFVDQPNGSTSQSASPLRGDSYYLVAPPSGGIMSEDSRAMAALQFMARAGMAANPDQFHLVASKLNQDKGAKGPGGWMPFLFANRPEDHGINAEYVRAWRSVVASERKAFAETFGYQDPNFLREDREDRLAMRRVDLDLDQTGRWTRWAADAYVNYFDSPNLQDPALYQRIRATAAIAEAKLAFGLAIWQFSPVNQVYLRGRRYIVDGFGKAFFDGSGASIKDKSAVMWKWIRDRQAGVPFLGTSQAPKLGEDAIYTLHDIVRSGKVQNIAMPLGGGDILSSHTGRVFAADPRSMWRYVGGEENAFGPDFVRAAARSEVSFLPEHQSLVRMNYTASLDRAEFVARLAGSDAASVKFWRRQLSFLDGLVAEDLAKSAVQPSDLRLSSFGAEAERMYLNRKVLRSARRAATSEFQLFSSSQMGREILRPTPFVQEVYDLLRAGRGKDAARKGILELMVKTADYGLKGTLGVMEQLPAILAIEASASWGATALQSKVTVRPDYGHFDFSKFKGGLFGWYRSQLSDITSSRVASRLESRSIIYSIRSAESEASRIPAAQARLARLLAQRPLTQELRYGTRSSRLKGMTQNGLVPLLAPSALTSQIRAAEEELDRLFDLERSIPVMRTDLVSQLRRADFLLSRRGEMESMVRAEAPWIEELLSDQSRLGPVRRWAAQHPRIIGNLASARNLPGDLGRALRAPFALHAAISSKINSSNRLFKILEETDEAGKVTRSLGARMEGNLLLRTANKAASFKGVATGVGGVFNSLAFIESGMRYKEAGRLASTSWDSLAIDEKGALESYVYPSSREAMKSGALDVGLPFTPWGAVQGLALSMANRTGRIAAGVRAPQQFHEEHFQQMLFGKPTFASMAAVELDRRHNARIGILPLDLRFTPKIVNDTASYMSQIRKIGAQKEASQKAIDKKIQGVRNNWRLISETGSLGYERESSMFKQADQYTSDNSRILLPHLETKPVMVRREESYSRADRAAYLAQQADLRRRSELVHQARVSKGFLQKAWFYLAASSEQQLTGGMAQDSLDALRDLKARDSVRLRK